MSTHDLSRRQFLTAGAAIGAIATMPKLAEAQESGGRLTLHAIDTYFGQTRAGLQIDLSIRDGDSYRLIKTVETVERGRTEEPLLVGDELQVGRYELLMHVEEYFDKQQAELPNPPFLSNIPIRFAVYDASQKFHVPILFSPWSYSYYRGS
ncbi:MAG: hydroxyisourate hydrolase [Gammaproteobacteria bacterium]|nr:hydroxyisourate hydrolase [Gammaproteobacteria bacterium]